MESESKSSSLAMVQTRPHEQSTMHSINLHATHDQSAWVSTNLLAFAALLASCATPSRSAHFPGAEQRCQRGSVYYLLERAGFCIPSMWFPDDGASSLPRQLGKIFQTTIPQKIGTLPFMRILRHEKKAVYCHYYRCSLHRFDCSPISFVTPTITKHPYTQLEETRQRTSSMFCTRHEQSKMPEGQYLKSPAFVIIHWPCLPFLNHNCCSNKL